MIQNNSTASGASGAPVMDEGSQEKSDGGEGSNTVEVPASAIGQSKPGDTVSMKVISINAESGMATLSPAMPAENPNASGTDEMAAEFAPDKMAPKE